MKDVSVAEDVSEQRLVGQLADEFLARLERGEEPALEEYAQRYPQVAAILRQVLPALQVMRSPAPDDLLTPPAHTGGPLGDYRLLREVGRGGMGIVYEAEQVSLGRRVALKVLPFAAALDPKQLQRFKQEAQAAAHLVHQNIVAIYGVGCERGVHYYAMQFIDGQTLAAVIAELRRIREIRNPKPETRNKSEAPNSKPEAGSLADPTQAVGATRQEFGAADFEFVSDFELRISDFCRRVAQLGIQAAEALEHAHQQGVIHRDIKPANLLVATTSPSPLGGEGRGEGLRLWVTDFGLARLGSDAALTLTGDVLGTLRYMSPEQALGRRELVDHRTDLYALGATLYELLTLEPVFSGHDREELLRQITHEEPRPPRQVNPALPADLETVVLKALAKEPAERYATAQELADDLERFLKDEPIRARRPTVLHRTSKWARRHKAVAWSLGVSGFAVLLIAVAALLVSNVLITREMNQKAVALDQARREKERADLNLAQAHQAVRDYLEKTAYDSRLKEDDFHDLRKQLLATVVPFYEEFVRQKQDDPELEAARARAYRGLAFVRQEMGETDAALADYEQMQAILEKLVADFPTVPHYRHELAASHNGMGVVQRDLGRHGEAEAQFHKARALQEPLVADFPSVPKYRQDLAKSHHDLGRLLARLGRRAEAEAEYHKALELREKLVVDFPAVSKYQQELASSHDALGLLLKDLGRWDEAEAQHRKALNLIGQLVAGFPAVAEYRQNLSISHNSLGLVLRNLGRRDEAEAQYLLARALLEKLAAAFPVVSRYRHELGKTHNNLGVLLKQLGRHGEAEAQYHKALELWEKLAADFPRVPAYAVDLGGSYCNFGHLVKESGRPQEALDWYARAIATLELVVANERQLIAARRFLRNAHQGRARALGLLHRHAEAVKDWDRAIELNDQRQQEPSLRSHRALALARAGDHVRALAEANQLAQAKEATAYRLYDLACVCSLASAAVQDDAGLKEQYATRAVALLRQAVVKGWKNVAHLKKDTDLDPLRSRGDFQKLLAELEAKKE